MAKQKILVVEDDIAFIHILERYLNRHDYEIVATTNLKEAKINFLEQHLQYGLILLDYNLPDGKGSDFVEFLKSHNSTIPILIMTSFNDVKTAVAMMKQGVKEYITKPINQEELLMQINSFFNHKQALEPSLTAVTKPVLQLPNHIIGQSLASQHLHQQLSLVAQTEMSVLIQGESGTGKENIAKTLHTESNRHNKPFIAIDCGALSNELAGSELFGHVKGAFSGAIADKKGQFELAQGGTIFLDEVGNLSYENQIKLLRVIQEKEILPVGGTLPKSIDVRIITATNENLLHTIKEGQFREDLYYRINEFNIKVPKLVDRLEDLDEFVAYFIQKANNQLDKNVLGVNEGVRALFQKYSWPGNIRELQNIIKRGVLLAQKEWITLAELPIDMQLSIALATDTAPNEIQDTNDIKVVNEKMEKELIIKTLIETKYNKSKAAKILKMDRSTLYSKLAKYKIDLD